MLPRGAQDPLKICFKYERSSEFCYLCGKIGHMQTQCTDSAIAKGESAYGPWMRVEGLPTRDSYNPNADSGSSPLLPVFSVTCPLVKELSFLLGLESSAAVMQPHSDRPEPQELGAGSNAHVKSVRVACVTGDASKILDYVWLILKKFF